MNSSKQTSGKPYQPKGGMCCACENMQPCIPIQKLKDCSKLDFKNMPVIKEDDDCIIVKCTSFIPAVA